MKNLISLTHIRLTNKRRRNPETQPIDKLDESKATLRVLLYLHKKGQTKLTTIIQDLSLGQKAVYTALDTLKNLALVKEETSQEFPFTRKFRLTQKGEKTAIYLAQIEHILSP